MKVAICINCFCEFKPHRNSKKKYCSVKCQTLYQYKQYILRWKNGLEKGYGVHKTLDLSSHIRRYMLEKYNNSCQKCGWNQLHPIDNKPLVEINHIDGDAENCKEENLEVLCPNCHSMTETFRARNKKSKRNRKNGEVTDTVIVPV